MCRRCIALNLWVWVHFQRSCNVFCSEEEAGTSEAEVPFKSLVTLQAAPDVRQKLGLSKQQAPSLYQDTRQQSGDLAEIMDVYILCRWTLQDWLWWMPKPFLLVKHIRCQVVAFSEHCIQSH